MGETDAAKLQAEFVAAYAEITNPKKNANNPAFHSKYADLEETLGCIRPILNSHGIALIQQPVVEDNRIGVETYVIGHGSMIDLGAYSLPFPKQDPQGAGSAITYARRYALAAIFGLAQEDDDGNAASKPAPKPKLQAVKSEFDAVYELAAKNDRKGELAFALNNPKTKEEARLRFEALSQDERDELKAMLS